MRKNPHVFTFRGNDDIKSALETICAEYNLKPAEFLAKAIQSKINECMTDLGLPEIKCPEAVSKSD